MYEYGRYTRTWNRFDRWRYSHEPMGAITNGLGGLLGAVLAIALIYVGCMALAWVTVWLLTDQTTEFWVSP